MESSRSRLRRFGGGFALGIPARVKIIETIFGARLEIIKGEALGMSRPRSSRP